MAGSVTSKKMVFFLLFVLTAALICMWLLHPKESSPFYVTSPTCKECHKKHYESWSNTLHPKMFRPVKNNGALILGDFTSKDPALTFSKDAIEYVVGSHHEQIYVKKIDGEYYPLPARWSIEQKKWSSYRVDSWKKTPMSKQCNGCHTTGFNPETYEFSEFGIGCEACHGPGSRHVTNQHKATSLMCRICHRSAPQQQTDIIRSVSSTVCGQCHNRGKNRSFSDQQEPIFNFPVQYIPGEDLAKSFNPLTPTDDKNNRFWWGNGMAKAKHLEFADWEKSDHAKTLTSLKQKHTSEMEELKDSCLQCHSTDYLLADNDHKPTLHTAQYGITCVACHNPHTLIENKDSGRKFNEPCIRCHTKQKKNCKGRADPIHFPCPTDKVECVDCHMPYIVQSGGQYSIRGHAFIIISPLENSALSMPNSCQNGSCHQDRSTQWIQDEYRKYYITGARKN